MVVEPKKDLPPNQSPPGRIDARIDFAIRTLRHRYGIEPWKVAICLTQGSFSELLSCRGDSQFLSGDIAAGTLKFCGYRVEVGGTNSVFAYYTDVIAV